MERETTFEDLKKLAQGARSPCGKQAFSMRGAKDAAKIRNKIQNGKTFYPVVCFEGCGRAIFHLTTKEPGGRAAQIYRNQALSRNRRVRDRRRRRRLRERAEICVWEGEGGSYGE